MTLPEPARPPAWCCILAVVAGCTGAAPPPPPAAPPPSQPALPTPAPVEAAPLATEAAQSSTQVEPQPANPPAEPVDAAQAPTAGVQAVTDACAALCQKAAEECSSRSARRCRANCERYQSIADRCQNEVLRAIKCQASVPGLVCSNVVGQCSEDFRVLSACESGANSSTTVARATASLPTEWTELRDTEAGFTIKLPRAVPATTQGGQRTWRAEDASGVTYVVALRPPFKTEVNDKNLVVRVLEIVGYQCQKDLKIHGRFEVSGKTAVRFDTVCQSGDAWHGMLRISDEHVIMTAEVVPPGKTGQGDPFYFSFAYID